jgi:O-antigen/teichoic acid export membrane protein
MPTRRRIAGNLLWTWGGLAVGLVTGFVLTPFLVNRLGNTSYGIWVVIGSLTSYFGLLELGTRGSVGRNIAYFSARGDQTGVNAVASTAVAILLAVAGVVLAATFAVSFWFDRLFEIPPDEAADARLAFVLVGVSMALNLAVGVFDALLWGYQRFGALNGVEIVTELARTAVTFYVIGAGHGLLALAVITLAFTAAGHGAKVVAVARLVRGLRLRPGLVTRAAARLIFGYGMWTFFLVLGKMATDQSAPLIIGARLGLGLVTLFAIAQRLVSYANLACVRTAEVFVPVAAGLHAQEDRQRQRRLFLEGGRYSFVLALFFLPLYLLLGNPFIALWVGPGFELSAVLLAVLALGEVLPISQQFSRAIIMGMGRPRPLALIALAESVAVVTIALLVAHRYGLLGIAVTYAACGAASRGLGQILLVCRVVGVGVGRYLLASVLPALAVAALPAAVLAGLAAWRVPSTWVELIAYGAVYGACYLLWAAALLVGPRRLAARASAALRRLRGAPADPRPESLSPGGLTPGGDRDTRPL